jgi:hypothetical protein
VPFSILLFAQKRVTQNSGEYKLYLLIISEARAANQVSPQTQGRTQSLKIIERWVAHPMDSCSDNIDLEVPGPVKIIAMISYEDAYPNVEFLPRSRNWWAWLKGTPAECVHLGSECDWIATLVPDIICLQGKRRKRRDPIRPEITLCLECLAQTATPDLAEFEGRTVAFEPDPELLTQYFFIERDDFAAAGLRPEVADAISSRLMQNSGACQVCGHHGKWLWLSREQVPSLDEVDRIAAAPGEWFCAKHGAEKLFSAFDKIEEANIFYMNLPYGESGAYVWI